MESEKIETYADVLELVGGLLAPVGLGDELETGNAAPIGRKFWGMLGEPVELLLHVFEPSTSNLICTVESVV